MGKKAVVLLSGGLDSSVVAYLAKKQGFDIYAITFNYDQRHNKEIESAEKVAKALGAKELKIVELKLSDWGTSALTNKAVEIEKGDINRSDIPQTYVPARNMVFLSVAASYAEALESQDIFIGVSEVDYSGYVDCRKEFIEAMEAAINLGTVMGAEKGLRIKVHAPFVHKTKAEEVKLGLDLGLDFSLTWSCYRGEDKPCGTCDSCMLRAKAFAEAGVEDASLRLKQ